jgi:hypothetical protein
MMSEVSPVPAELGTVAGEKAFAIRLSAFLSQGVDGLELRADGPRGRGMFATRALPRGFSVTVPTELLLSTEAALATCLGVAFRSAVVQPPLTDEEVFLAVLAHARGPHSFSPFAPYAAVLPVEVPGVSGWVASHQQLLAGTDLGEALAEAEADIEELGHKLAAAVAMQDSLPIIPVADLRWARGMLLSRRFSDLCRSEDDSAPTPSAVRAWGDRGVLIPLLDFINHDRQALVALTGSLDGPHVCLTNTAPLAMGAEALNNYGMGRVLRAGDVDVVSFFSFFPSFFHCPTCFGALCFFF